MTKVVVKRVKVCSIDELPNKIGKAFYINNKNVALFKISDEKVNAIENSCPHKGGELSQGIVSGEFVFCPLHDWKICTDNGKVQSPDVGCVSSYRTEVINKSVYVYLKED